MTTNARKITSSRPSTDRPDLAVVCQHDEVVLAEEVGRNPIHPRPAGAGSRRTHGDDRHKLNLFWVRFSRRSPPAGVGRYPLMEGASTGDSVWPRKPTHRSTRSPHRGPDRWPETPPAPSTPD